MGSSGSKPVYSCTYSAFERAFYLGWLRDRVVKWFIVRPPDAEPRAAKRTARRAEERGDRTKPSSPYGEVTEEPLQ